MFGIIVEFDPIAITGKIFLCNITDLLFIVYKDNVFSISWAHMLARFSHFCRGISFSQWQEDTKHRAYPRFAVDDNFSSM